MGTQASDRAIALAILGILVSLVLTILTAAKASSTAIIACGGVTIVLIVLLYIPVLRQFYRDAREELERRSLRSRGGEKLTLVSGDQVDLPPSRLPDGVYGYEEIFGVSGLRSSGEHADAARIKPDRTNPNGFPYPLEVHKFNGETWLVGYVAPQFESLAKTETETGPLSLWMRRTKVNHVLVEIQLSRVDPGEKSLGDRSWDSSAKNIFRLVLQLSAKAGIGSSVSQPVAESLWRPIPP